MASIVKLAKGKQPPRAIGFFDAGGKRQRLRLGKVTHDVATEFKRRIERNSEIGATHLFRLILCVHRVSVVQKTRTSERSLPEESQGND